MRGLLATILVVYVCCVGVECAKLVEVSRTRRQFAGLRAKKSLITLRDIEESLDLGGDVTLKATGGQLVESSKGVQRERVQEYYMGLPVDGTVAELEVEHGKLTGQAYGKIVNARELRTEIPDVTVCTRSCKEMLSVALREENIDVEDKAVESVKCEKRVWEDPKTGKSKLVYDVDFVYITKKVQKIPHKVIDACNKTILAEWDRFESANLRRGEGSTAAPSLEDTCPGPEYIPVSDCQLPAVGFGGNEKSNRTIYGHDGVCLQVQKEQNLCTMDSEFVKVVDNQGSSSRRAVNEAVTFKCSEGYRDPINGAYGVANDALYFGSKTFSFFKDVFNFNALSWKPRMVVHYDRQYDNAFWDGTDMYFGDGYSTFYPLVVLDVTAHELAHGITSTNSNLHYSEQSGGINEAFSDITGTTVQYYVRGSNNWLIGGYVGKSRPALRYMMDPPRDGRSIKHASDFQPGMDVHYSSGVFNYAFYWLVEEEKMDIIQAYECFLEANRVEWGSRTNYVEGGCDVVKACYDQGFDIAPVIRAFAEVGINVAQSDGCDPFSLDSVMTAGDTRTVKMSSTRRPIIQLDNGGTHVTVAEGQAVTIEICTTADCQDNSITQTGSGEVEVNSTGGDVYVRLSTGSTTDQTFDMTWA